MSGPCSTVRIASPVSTDNSTGFIVVNETDFDEKTMTLYEPTPETEAEIAAREQAEADAATALEADRVAAASAAALAAASAPPAIVPAPQSGWGTAPPPSA